MPSCKSMKVIWAEGTQGSSPFQLKKPIQTWRGICAAGAARKKVVAAVSRCERACKRTGEPSVPFCDKGGTTARVTDFSA